MRLFVYGSLLRGEDNHAELRGARFVAEVRTAERYTLVDLGPYPALVEGGTTAVIGELYEVGAALLARLDEFEGHPDEYVRSPIALDGGGAAEGYLLPPPRAAGFPHVLSGDWRGRPRKQAPSGPQ